MVSIKCVTKDTISLDKLTPFQGTLKKRTDKDIRELANSICSEGLLMPFAVWKHNDQNLLLDGHGRLTALNYLAGLEEHADVAKQKFPCVFIEANTEDEAKKALLQITSSYGKITKEGAIKFCATIPNYKAPAISKYVHKKQNRKPIERLQTETLIRIRVPAEKADEVKALLAQVEYIKVL